MTIASAFGENAPLAIFGGEKRKELGVTQNFHFTDFWSVVEEGVFGLFFWVFVELFGCFKFYGALDLKFEFR
jgi:hypothetical protein